MYRIEVVYNSDKLAPVTYLADHAERVGNLIWIQNTNKDGSITDSYIHLESTALVSITKINNEENENGT